MIFSEITRAVDSLSNLVLCLILLRMTIELRSLRRMFEELHGLVVPKLAKPPKEATEPLP